MNLISLKYRPLWPKICNHVFEFPLKHLYLLLSNLSDFFLKHTWLRMLISQDHTVSIHRMWLVEWWYTCESWPLSYKLICDIRSENIMTLMYYYDMRLIIHSNDIECQSRLHSIILVKWYIIVLYNNHILPRT